MNSEIMPHWSRLADLKRLSGMGESWLYEKMDRGDLPKPIKLSRRASVWKTSDFLAALDRLAAKAAGVQN